MKINYILALLAIAGGVSAAFTNHASRNDLYPTWKFEKDRVEGRKVNYISAVHLADLLYEKRTDITLLDARNRLDYESYHIPQARHYDRDEEIPEESLSGMVIVYGAQENDYSGSWIKELPSDAYLLKGGIDQWNELVLFPDFITLKVRNGESAERIITRSRYFGGTPQNTQLLNIKVRESRYREGC
jgi:rhodanese-related sulfurtransferase